MNFLEYTEVWKYKRKRVLFDKDKNLGYNFPTTDAMRDVYTVALNQKIGENPAHYTVNAMHKSVRVVSILIFSMRLHSVYIIENKSVYFMGNRHFF